MRYAIIIAMALVFTPSYSTLAASDERGKTPQQSTIQSSVQDPRGTDVAPLIVKVLPNPKTVEENSLEAADRESKNHNDQLMVKFTGALVIVGLFQLAVFLLQLVVFGLQARRLKQTILKMEQIAAGQTADMNASIAAASRAATAMEVVATSMADNVASIKDTVSINREMVGRQKLTSELQLRAYITAKIGAAIYQDRKNNLKFEGKVIIINTGNTPAQKVLHNTQSAILPVPLPKDYVLPQYTIAVAGENMIGPHQDRTLSCVVADYVNDNNVVNIKAANGSGLYIWGYVEYEDAFGVARKTNFCHLLMWRKDDSLVGYFIPDRNSAS